MEISKELMEISSTIMMTLICLLWLGAMVVIAISYINEQKYYRKENKNIGRSKNAVN